MKTKVMIGIPNLGYVKTELMAWIINQMKNQDYEIHLIMPNHRPCDYNRNVIVEEFLKSGCEWLLQIDDDIAPIHNLLDLIKHNKKIVSADVQTVKGREIIKLAMEQTKDGWKQKKLEAGLNEVDAVGTGVLLTHREVYEKLDKPYYKYHYDKDGMLIQGLDFQLCKRAKEKGFKVYYDNDIKVRQHTEVYI
jgi:GT2 family glycosyltransferase